MVDWRFYSTPLDQEGYERWHLRLFKSIWKARKVTRQCGSLIQIENRIFMFDTEEHHEK